MMKYQTYKICKTQERRATHGTSSEWKSRHQHLTQVRHEKLLAHTKMSKNQKVCAT